MRDGAAGQVEASRLELYDDYVHWFLRESPDVRPCRDARLQEKAARYLQREPEPRGTFAVFPLYQGLSAGSRARSSDCRKLVSAFIRAIDMLETICVNLLLQPWKKEIKTIKTFTGAFVYRLLPVLSRTSIQSVLAAIGYVLHADAPQSEYRLSDGATPERALQVGFELMLARVECYHLLELLDKNQPGPQEWLEVLQRRRGPTKPEEPSEEKTATSQKEEQEEKRKEDVDRKEAPQYLNTRLAMKPQPKPRRYHLPTADKSIIEMQMTYSDLTFRGRPLLPDKPLRASIGRGRSTNHSDEGKAAATTTSGKNDGGKASETFVDNPGDAVINGDAEPVDGEPGTPQAVALHITLRTASTAGQGLQPHTAAEQSKTVAGPGPPSPVSTEERLQPEELAERLDQLQVHEEAKEERKRGGTGAHKETKKRARRASAESEAEEQPTETDALPGLRLVAGRFSRSGGDEEEQLGQGYVLVERHKQLL